MLAVAGAAADLEPVALLVASAAAVAAAAVEPVAAVAAAAVGGSLAVVVAEAQAARSHELHLVPVVVWA